MSQNNTEYLVLECRIIEENAKYKAITHYVIANGTEIGGFWLKIIPAAVASASGALVLSGYPTWLAWLSIVSGLVFAIYTVLDPDKKANDHRTAHREYTVLKHEARTLERTFSKEMSHTDFYHAVLRLKDKYDSLTRNAPLTTNRAFEKARERIRMGRYTQDFEEEQAQQSHQLSSKTSESTPIESTSE